MQELIDKLTKINDRIEARTAQFKAEIEDCQRRFGISVELDTGVEMTLLDMDASIFDEIPFNDFDIDSEIA
jgi:hypothetical protein